MHEQPRLLPPFPSHFTVQIEGAAPLGVLDDGRCVSNGGELDIRVQRPPVIDVLAHIIKALERDVTGGPRHITVHSHPFALWVLEQES